MAQTPAARLEATLRTPRGEIAWLRHLTAGYPKRSALAERLVAAAQEVDVLVVGVPFSDPTADGLSRAELHRAAVREGASLRWILSVLGQVQPSVPVVLATYVNPLLAYGLHRLVPDLGEVGVAGLLVLDLPSEESDELRRLCAPLGLALASTVAEATSLDRRRRVCGEATGFVHAVGRPGPWLGRVRDISPVPVCVSVDDPADAPEYAGGAHGVVLRDRPSPT